MESWSPQALCMGWRDIFSFGPHSCGLVQSHCSMENEKQLLFAEGPGVPLAMGGAGSLLLPGILSYLLDLLTSLPSAAPVPTFLVLSLGSLPELSAGPLTCYPLANKGPWPHLLFLYNPQANNSFHIFKRLGKRTVCCDIKMTCDSDFIKLLLEWSSNTCVLSVAAFTLQWQSCTMVAATETLQF